MNAASEAKMVSDALRHGRADCVGGGGRCGWRADAFTDALAALDELVAENARLRAALDAAEYLIRALEDVTNEIPRRDLDEAFERWGEALAGSGGDTTNV